MDRVDVLVIGAGVIGLAIARELAQAGREVVILEGQSAIGTGTSSRNSGVIHAGIYYPTGSNKARWCVEGRHLLYAYAKQRNLTHRRTEKLIVAAAPESGRLEQLFQTGRANGVDDLTMISGEKAQSMEPQLHCDSAIHSPSTGIIDVHDLMLALLGDAQAHGATLALQSRFDCSVWANGRWECEILGQKVACDWLINAAGLDAAAVAGRIEGLGAQHIPKMFFAKGSYARLQGRPPFSRLIYPVPVPGGLGTHLTLDCGGQAQFGPNVQWLDTPSMQQVETGLIEAFDYAVNADELKDFERDVRHWWPGLPKGALTPGYSGVRPKLSGPGEPAADFMLQGPAAHGCAGLINLFGFESPGLTSCLAIGLAVREIA